MGLLLFPQLIYAHSALVSAVPAESKPTTSEVTEINLKFNTPIEPVSSLKVTDESGSEFPLKETKTDDDNLMGVLEQPLTNGVYNVNWKIIGEDGHSIKGSYSFEVRIPEEEAIPSDEQLPTDSEAQEQVVLPTPAAIITPSETPIAPDKEDNKSTIEKKNTIIDVILIAVSALVVISFVSLLFKKKNK